MGLAEKTDALNEALDDAETVFEMRFKVHGVPAQVPLADGYLLAWAARDKIFQFVVVSGTAGGVTSPLLRAPRHLRVAAAAALPALWQALEEGIVGTSQDVERAIAMVRAFTDEKLAELNP